MIGIYKIVNNINGKFYVGQSNDIDRRFVEHCSPNRYKQSNIPVDWAIHKYGKENFSLITIFGAKISLKVSFKFFVAPFSRNCLFQSYKSKLLDKL